MTKNAQSEISNLQSLRVLMVEDSEDDALLVLRELKKGGYNPEHVRVETAAAMRKALQDKTWDVILCDYQLPGFNGIEAIAVLRETNIDIPILIVSGAIVEEMAVECMRLGAHDYIMKNNLSRLCSAIARELKEADLRSKHKQMEAALQESEESYRNLFENAGEAIFVVQDGKLVFLNPMTARIIDYSAEEIMSRPFIEFIHPDDRDMVIDRHVRRMKGEELPHLYSFRIIRRDGNIRWVELNAVLINWKGKAASLNFLSDITERKQAEEQLRESLEQVRRAMQTTIQVLVTAVEIKDPYTAGHQRRMTNLARTMATEMGLPPEKIEGLRMAGVIHDIGKITLPVEILSKPTKLSDIELSLIREHVRLGYDILKDVESPWPLAEIVLQHHERMDGSGYPRGLKGEEILIEARIIAVADVVEAMASHRPYRPALGLDAALEEISKNRGILYDPEVTDACLRLFQEKGYSLN
ncbi:MAG: PAS domain S-box protein [Planctomycetes bacterium]|nr:PAS domain S-box protein [Planctomycetota bacterium]